MHPHVKKLHERGDADGLMLIALRPDKPAEVLP
jgi:hypothetical protein